MLHPSCETVLYNKIGLYNKREQDNKRKLQPVLDIESGKLNLKELFLSLLLMMRAPVSISLLSRDS